MSKFTIIAILALMSAATMSAGKDLKDQVQAMISSTKNRVFDQVQEIKKLAATNVDEFIARVTKTVDKSWLYMDVLKKKFGKENNISCDKAKDDIFYNSLEIISHFQSCIHALVNDADTYMNSIFFDATKLTEEILAAENVDDELYRKVAEFEERSFQFDQYLQRLEQCETQSNFSRLKWQISETFNSYKRCLQDK